MRPVLVPLILAILPAIALAQSAATPQAAPATSGQGEGGGPGAAEVDRNAEGEIVFHNMLTGKPLDMAYRPDQEITEAVASFHKTGENPYSGDEAAIAEGEKTYMSICAACHLPSGEGRIGPSLIDDEWNHPGLDSQIGWFEIIYGGGAGAMQAFGMRMDQDEILKVMAFLEALRAGKTG